MPELTNTVTVKKNLTDIDLAQFAMGRMSDGSYGCQWTMARMFDDGTSDNLNIAVSGEDWNRVLLALNKSTNIVGTLYEHACLLMDLKVKVGDVEMTNSPEAIAAANGQQVGQCAKCEKKVTLADVKASIAAGIKEPNDSLCPACLKANPPKK